MTYSVVRRTVKSVGRKTLSRIRLSVLSVIKLRARSRQVIQIRRSDAGQHANGVRSIDVAG
jgi:hypothetical protein